MFEQVLAVEYGRSNRAWTTMAGIAGQALIVTSAVLAPLVGPQALPHPQTLVQLFYPGAPVAPPPRAPRAEAQAPRPARPALQIREGQLTAPTTMPAKAAIIEEPPLTAAELGSGGGVRGGVEGGISDGMLHGLPAAVARQVAPPAPVRPAETPAPAKTAEPKRITIGGLVQQAKLLHQTIPLYPPLARQARVSGTVELVGIIGTDGRIRQLQVVSGHPLLLPAALEAVRQWVYRPTYLNGDPVEVIAPISVRFVMQ